MSALLQESDFDRLKRRGRKFLAGWKTGTGGGNGHRPAAPQGPQDSSRRPAAEPAWTPAVPGWLAETSHHR